MGFIYILFYFVSFDLIVPVIASIFSINLMKFISPYMWQICCLGIEGKKNLNSIFHFHVIFIKFS